MLLCFDQAWALPFSGQSKVSFLSLCFFAFSLLVILCKEACLAHMSKSTWLFHRFSKTDAVDFRFKSDFLQVPTCIESFEFLLPRFPCCGIVLFPYPTVVQLVCKHALGLLAGRF